MSVRPTPTEPVAIVGMAGRFPGAENLEQYWDNLQRGVESVTFFSDEELAAAGVDPELLRNPRFVRARGVLQGAELFDAVFFGLSPAEAKMIDPQHRVFLEAAWEALERSGYAPGAAQLNVGVYAGASLNTYLIENAIGNLEALMAAGGFQMLLANDKDFLTTRASYKLNLRGPSVAIQTACSTSLVAVQLACQGLIARQCDMALAGGVSVIVPRVGGYLYEQGMILSPDGHCRAFDAKAQGMVRGEGVGVVVLKRLRDAFADGDHIHAVIRGAALNNDGSLKVGYTAPSVDGQAEVIAMAHAMADIDPETVTYVEAHGTGTDLGDPIEVAGLTQAFRLRTQRRSFCALGSVKTNIGHLDVAAGVAGLIKTVLALEHRALPPSLNFAEPNPQINFAASPFYVNAALAEWKAVGDAPRRAGVSSFGIGGTNAHVVLEEAPAPVLAGSSRPVQLLTLSAKSDAALERATSALGAHLASHPDLALADVAYTLHRGRTTFPHRRVVVAATGDEAGRALEQKDTRRVIAAVESQKERPVVFMFSGQGSQYVGMGRGLYETEPAFRDHVDACSETLAPLLGFDLREVLDSTPGTLEASQARLSTTAVTQPALFVVEYALARLFMEWGVRPQAMIGHSIGEYVAACLAGVMGLEDALRLVAERGRLMEVPGGAMLAVPMAERELGARLPAELSIAAVNGPARCAVSGPAPAVEALRLRLAQQGVAAQPIHAASAFHSAMMEPILGPFTEAVNGVALAGPTIPYVSNVTGTWMAAEDAVNPGYWARHVRQAVRFWDGLQEITREGDAVLLEVGPGHILASLARQTSSRKHPAHVLSALRHPHDQQSDAAVLQATVGRLWLAGVPVDWAGYHGRERRRRVPLPTYPFERQRHWITPASPAEEAPIRLHQLVKRPDIAEWFYVPSWRRSVVRALATEKLAGGWLLFADDCGLATAIAGWLRQSGARVTTVEQGKEFSRLAEGRFAVNPDVRDDYDRLVAELKAAGAFPPRILHLWSVTQDDEASGIPEASAAGQARGFYSLLFFAQALSEHAVREPLAIGVVVNSLHDVTGEDVFRPDRATVLGPSIVIPQEYPHVSCRAIDVVLPKTACAIDLLVEQLLGELEQPLEAAVVAYRGRYRWVQGVEAVRLECARTRATLRPGGVYVITGGLGGIGLVLAKHFAERVSARLVLVGRSVLPPREDWTSWLESHNEADAAATKIRAIGALEEAGAQVLVLSADVSQPEEMARVVAEARRRFGAIHGVVHAAGVAGGGIVQLKTPEIAERVLGSKLKGTTNLGQLLGDNDLDFVFLCSSITAVLGGPGQADYCGANAFLDAFARSRPPGTGPTRVVSVNWDVWQEVGMAVNTAVPAAFREQRLRDLAHGILPAEGVEAFERVLGSDFSEVIVSTRELPRLIALARRAADAAEPAQEPRRDADAAAPVSSRAHANRAGLLTPFVEPSTELERAIAKIWEKLLGIESIGTRDDFFEAGGHSLVAIQVMSRLYQRFDVDIPLRTLFEAPTVAAFAERVEEIVRAAGAGREEIEL
jgi:acyl transferase domain-containing protein/acyl carrier protein